MGGWGGGGGGGGFTVVKGYGPVHNTIILGIITLRFASMTIVTNVIKIAAK